MAFTCPEEQCGLFDGMPCYITTVEQCIVHWNTFHVAIVPVVTCMVAGCPAKFNSGPNTVDAFFKHVIKKHKNLCNDGKWPHLNGLMRVGMSSGPNTCYWHPSSVNGPHLHPDPVNSLMAEEIQYPFLAARWVAHTEFQNLVRKDRPTMKKSGKA